MQCNDVYASNFCIVNITMIKIVSDYAIIKELVSNISLPSLATVYQIICSFLQNVLAI